MKVSATVEKRQDALELRSVAVFLAVLLALECALAILLRTAAGERLCVLTAGAAGNLANLFGASAVITGVQVALPERVLYVNAECTGVFLIGLYAALVAASPISPSSKATGLVFGACAIVAANLVRLAVVVGISGFEGALFAFLHDFLFQAAMLLVVLGVWAAWLSRVRSRELD